MSVEWWRFVGVNKEYGYIELDLNEQGLRKLTLPDCISVLVGISCLYYFHRLPSVEIAINSLEFRGKNIRIQEVPLPLKIL